jgi:GrpB-like predicted nucleotidyltransferase (UPF0157 family)
VRSLRDVVVHGIVAKPIIDVLVEVESLRRLDQETPALEAIGYEAKGEYGIPRRRYFRKDDARGVRTHQLHAFEKQSGHIARHLAFRDYMIAHPDEAQTYATLKQRWHTSTLKTSKLIWTARTRTSRSRNAGRFCGRPVTA